MWCLLLTLLAGCGSDRVRSYTEGLRSGDCDGIGDATLRADCLAQAGRCEEVAGEDAEECWFRAAEQRSDVSLCARAGPFAFDCQMHLYTRGLQVEVADARVSADETAVAARIAAAGFAADDPRPWSAWYRHALGRRRPLDRAPCRELPDPAHQEACLQTGLALYADYLNMARDRHLYKCDGSGLPALVQTTPDPELDAMRDARGDPCAR